MGKSNLKHGLERKIAFAKGAAKAAEKEIAEIQEGLRRLIPLRADLQTHKAIIEAAETILRYDHPGWSGDHIKPMRAGVWASPFRSGEQGRLALTKLREADDWLRPREVVKQMLDDIDHDPEDQVTLEKVTNSVGNYFKKYEGELVESRGDFAKEWRVIPPKK